MQMFVVVFSMNSYVRAIIVLFKRFFDVDLNELYTNKQVTYINAVKNILYLFPRELNQLVVTKTLENHVVFDRPTVNLLLWQIDTKLNKRLIEA